ncbi:MAG: hypothetical protein AAB623_00180 [Patescibacteria group bacterium]
MRIGKEPAPQKGQQERFDFEDDLKDIEKAYFDYTPKERMTLIERIRDKLKKDKPLTKRQKKFLEKDAAFFGQDDQDRHRY